MNAIGEHENRPSDAHEVALDLLKQLITLASGVLALSATFIERLGAESVLGLVVLGLSWLALLVSVFSGLQAMSAVVKSRLDSDHDWSSGSGQVYARLAKYGFLVGILLFALFAFLSVLTKRAPSEYLVVRQQTAGYSYQKRTHNRAWQQTRAALRN